MRANYYVHGNQMSVEGEEMNLIPQLYSLRKL